MNNLMSSVLQAVVLGSNLTGAGNRPVRTPAHQLDLETGIGPKGARIDLMRTNPVSGSDAMSESFIEVISAASAR
jgi:hypothetical protein